MAKQVVASGLTNLPPSETRARILELINTIETSYFELARRLYEVKYSKFYVDWGYQTWSDYCEKELKMTDRKADYLVQIWEVVVTRFDLAEEIKQLEWSKAKEVAKVAKRIPQTSILRKVIDVAKRSSLRELEDYVKNLVREYRIKTADAILRKNGSSENEEIDINVPENELFHLNFMVYADAYKVIIEALEKAREITGSEHRSYNLQVIAAEFLSLYGGLKDDILRSFLRRLEMSLNATIIVIDNKTGKILYGEETLREIDK